MDFILDFFLRIGRSWTEFLLQYLSNDLVKLINYVIAAVILIALGIGSTIVLVWFQRKMIARIQDRLGPNRAGPKGMLIALADAIKLLLKEDTTPKNADRIIFNLAPVLMVFSGLMVLAVVPWGHNMIAADINIGILYVVAVGSISTFSVLMAGWGSNNKYALLGGFRVVAQLLSYEIPLLLSIATVVLLAGSMSTQSIALAQSPLWYVFVVPTAFLTFVISAAAELGRTPFDLTEAESELVAGFNIEYSGIKFAWLFLGEYINLFALSGIAATMFLGGWRGPFVDQVPILGVAYFAAKVMLFAFFFFWVMGTFPRLRIDQLQTLAWKVLVPISLANLLIVAIAVQLPGGWLPQTAFALVANIILLILTLGLLSRAARRFAQGRGGRMSVTA